MVSLVYPTVADGRYFHYDNHVFGPIGPEGYGICRMDLPIYTDAIVGTKGMYHENMVTHQHSSGEIYFHRDRVNEVPYPSADYPYRIQVPSGAVSVTINCGFSLPGRTTMFRNTGYYHQYAHIRGDGGAFIMWHVSAWRTKPTDIGAVQKVVLTPIKQSSTYGKWSVSVRIQSKTFAGSFKSVIDWSTLQTHDNITCYCEEYLASSAMNPATDTASTILCDYFRITGSGTMNAWEYSELLLDLVRVKVNSEAVPPDVHFGDLAMEAGQRVNKTNTNMISFLHDLKDVKSLIPSLGKMGLLHSASSNYLMLNYGWFPTVSDLKNIVTAVMRLAPYLDRNGFKTYNAGRTSFGSSENVSVQVDQKLKLAIKNNDSDLLNIVHKLEQFGAFPTFQSIWDLVPYSFVLDWFIDVGGLLQRVDSHLRVLRYDIAYVTMSRKQTTKVAVMPTVECPFIGTITTVNYHRWVSSHCPLPPLVLQTPLTDFDHWLESAALIVQRTSRSI